jgi:hypothetical protein
MKRRSTARRSIAVSALWLDAAWLDSMAWVSMMGLALQGLAAALTSHRPRAQHIGAAEGVLDELVGPVAAGQSRPPPPQDGREKNEAEDQAGQQQQGAQVVVLLSHNGFDVDRKLAAHVAGIQARFGAPVDRAALDLVPPPSLVWRAIKWLVPVLFIAALIWGWRRTDTASFVELMLAWILPTSIAAGGSTLLAGGSLASVLSAVVASPIAAIHPLRGTGRIVGVVEAWRRRPSAADCERLSDDIQSFGGFWRNPVTRTLLIAVASGTGTAVGFWIGVGWVASLL